MLAGPVVLFLHTVTHNQTKTRFKVLFDFNTLNSAQVVLLSKEIPINPLYIGHEQVLECTSELQGN